METYLKLLEDEILKNRYGSNPTSLYEPIRYIMKLGGKRMRPLLTLISYSLYKEEIHTILPYAIAVETFHNFTLLHDDIMDQAPLRRGKPTVHERWNVNTAILAGDVMLVRVYDIFLSLESAKLKEVLKRFNTCAAEVCEGQQWDMEFENKKNVTIEQYLSMIRLKTAVLLGFSLELGAILADAPELDREVVREFGINMGIAFQLRDDLLDVYADKKKFGKQQGGDIIANKRTFLLITALQGLRGKKKRELEGWLSAKKFDKREKVAAITKIYDTINVRAQTEEKIQEFVTKGFRCLDQLSVRERANVLIEFVEDLSKRQT